MTRWDDWQLRYLKHAERTKGVVPYEALEEMYRKERATRMAFVRKPAEDGLAIRKAEIEQMFDTAADGLLLAMADVDGVELDGITVTPNKRGGGFLAIVRISVAKNAGSVEEPFPFAEGKYCIFGGGATVFGALAAVVAAVEAEEADLKVDEMAVDRTSRTRWTGKARDK